MSLDRIDVKDFLTALGIEIDSVSGDNMLFCCPWHNDRHPSARMNYKTTAWLCSAGCGKGNAINFLAMLRGMSREDARDHIYARYGIGPGAPIDDLEAEVRRNLAASAEEQQRVLPDESWVEYLALDWEVNDRGHPVAQYMLGRGFTSRALARWQLGYDPLSKRVAIPVRDIDGTLVGFKGRAISDVYPRYLILGDPLGHPGRYGFNTYRKSEHAFALDRCIRDPDWQRSCYVVEGELNAIALRERFGKFAVAVSGSEFSDRQRELIATRCQCVTIYFDADEAGQRGTIKVASALSPFIDVRVIMDAPNDAAAISEEDFEDLQARGALELVGAGDLDLVL